MARLHSRGSVWSPYGYRSIATAETTPGRAVFVYAPALAATETGIRLPYELRILDMEAVSITEEPYTIDWHHVQPDEETATPTLATMGGGRFAFILPNAMCFVDTIVGGAPGWVQGPWISLGGSQSHNSSVTPPGGSVDGFKEFTVLDMGSHLMILGAGGDGVGYAEVSHAGVVLREWVLVGGPPCQSFFPTNAVLSGGRVWWPQVAGDAPGAEGVLRFDRDESGAWGCTWLPLVRPEPTGWLSVSQAIAWGGGVTFLSTPLDGEARQIFARSVPFPEAPVVEGPYPNGQPYEMGVMQPSASPPGITDDIFMGSAGGMASLKAFRVSGGGSAFGRLTVASYSSGWVVMYTAERIGVYRYDFDETGGGQWLLRQRQTLPGAGSWPLRQRQHGGATGSWPLRQRQRGV